MPDTVQSATKMHHRTGNKKAVYTLSAYSPVLCLSKRERRKQCLAFYGKPAPSLIEIRLRIKIKKYSDIFDRKQNIV